MLSEAMRALITSFPLGFVGSIAPDGGPAVSPKGTFLILDAQTLAYGDIRSPVTRRNLDADPRVEVNFIDPFRRKAVRVAGRAVIHPKGSERFAALLPRWEDSFGGLARRISALVVISLTSAAEILTPPYDDGVTEEEMIALYRAKYEGLFG